MKATLKQSMLLIHVASGDFCTVSSSSSGAVQIGNITLLPDELEDFITVLREAVALVMRETAPAVASPTA